MAKRRNRRALRGFVTKKKAKKKAVKKAAKKVRSAKTRSAKRVNSAKIAEATAKVQKQVQRSKRAIIAATVPDLVKDKFMVVARLGSSVLRFLAGADAFVIAPEGGAILFESKEAAQKQIDDALMLADENAMIRSAKVEPASDHLETSYAFDPIPDEKMELGLVPTLVAKGSGKPFKEALKTIKGIIKESLSETKEAATLAVKVAERFKEQWG